MFATASEGVQAYQSSRIVRAAKIIGLDIGSDIFTVRFGESVDGMKETVVNRQNKPEPAPGWFIMFYDDGYISFCPPESFEKGYKAVAE